MKAKSIMPIWQPIGQSTNLISQKIGERFGVKTSHTGTLDPMAEGVIIVLLGEERLKKYEYANWKKTYTFDLIFGIETDTGDGLGFINRTDLESPVSPKAVRMALLKFVGPYEQTIPKFSAKLYKGKKLLEYAQKGMSTPSFSKSGEIYNLKLLGFKLISATDFVSDLISRIRLVRGNFRQPQVVHNWEMRVRSRTDPVSSLQVASIEVEMSKGLYVRSLAEDIARALGTVGFADRIIRTKNGRYFKGEIWSCADC